MTPPKPGDRYALPAVSTTDGRIQRDVTVAVEKVERLGCSCIRLVTTRPGPTTGPLSSAMHLHVNRCGWHQANSPDGTDEPQPAPQ